MLIKLLKYDLRTGIKQYVVIGAIFITLILSALLGYVIKISFIDGLIFTASLIFTIISFILFMFISPSRIYSQLAKDESYFSYILPVGIHKLLLSKIIAHIIWATATLFIIVVYWKIYYSFCPLEMIKEFISEIALVLDDSKEIAYLFIIAGSFYYIVTIVLIFIFSVALSNMPAVKDRNAGVAAMIISFFVIYQGLSLIMAGIWMLIVVINGGELSNEYLNAYQNIGFVLSNFAKVMLGTGVVASILLYLGSAHILNKKRSI